MMKQLWLPDIKIERSKINACIKKVTKGKMTYYVFKYGTFVVTFNSKSDQQIFNLLDECKNIVDYKVREMEGGRYDVMFSRYVYATVFHEEIVSNLQNLIENEYRLKLTDEVLFGSYDPKIYFAGLLARARLYADIRLSRDKGVLYCR